MPLLMKRKNAAWLQGIAKTKKEAINSPYQNRNSIFLLFCVCKVCCSEAIKACMAVRKSLPLDPLVFIGKQSRILFFLSYCPSQVRTKEWKLPRRHSGEEISKPHSLSAPTSPSKYSSVLESHLLSMSQDVPKPRSKGYLQFFMHLLILSNEVVVRRCVCVLIYT